jgi:dienelactone hydrolase
VIDTHRRHPRLRGIAASAALVLATGVMAMPATERVRFDSLDRDDGKPVAIDALLLRPPSRGANAGTPVVIALHGCNGMYSSSPGRESQLDARGTAYAEKLVGEGYAVLFVDSFGSRGVRQVCTIRTNERTIAPPRRRLDVLGALQWLGTQRWVARDAIALVGWSHGGSTTLATISAENRDVAAFRKRADAPFVRAAFAFYPGCNAALRDERWRPAVTTRIVIGAADDWTPAPACEALGARGREQRWPLEVTVYPGAHHGFDAPRGKVVHRTDVPNGARPGEGVHVGPDPAAREDAQRRLLAFLRASLTSP